jgi:uncharacterized membrane protein HdeD (DUF308 family)
MANGMTARVHPATTWSIVLSVLMIATGAFAIGVPLLTGFAVGAVIAWLLLFSGVLHLAFAWRGHGSAGVVWEILVGLAYGVVGTLVGVSMASRFCAMLGLVLGKRTAGRKTTSAFYVCACVQTAVRGTSQDG